MARKPDGLLRRRVVHRRFPSANDRELSGLCSVTPLGALITGTRISAQVRITQPSLPNYPTAPRVHDLLRLW